MMTPFTARRFGPDGSLYKSGVTGREYLVTKNKDEVRVHVHGRCIYGGRSAKNAFGMIELEDCVA